MFNIIYLYTYICKCSQNTCVCIQKLFECPDETDEKAPFHAQIIPSTNKYVHTYTYIYTSEHAYMCTIFVIFCSSAQYSYLCTTIYIICIYVCILFCNCWNCCYLYYFCIALLEATDPRRVAVNYTRRDANWGAIK